MHIVLIIICVVVWLILQFNLEKMSRDAGEPLLSRSQLRYLRKKARKGGTSLDSTPYRPRTRQSPIFLKDWLGPNSGPAPVHRNPPLQSPIEKWTPGQRWAGGLAIIGSIGLLYLATRPAEEARHYPPPPPSIVQPAQAAASSNPVPEHRMKQGANVRANASGNAPVLRTVPVNTVVRITETNGSWARIALNGVDPVGWVYRPLID